MKTTRDITSSVRTHKTLRRIGLTAFGVLFLLVVAATISSINVAKSQAAGNSPLLGVYRGENPDRVDMFSAWLGRDVDFAIAFGATDTWANITRPGWQLNLWGPWVNAQPGRNLVLAVPMFPDGQGSLAACSSGSYNTYWTTFANNLMAKNHPNAILRLGWEFNGDWSTWYATGHEADFIGCFRQIVTTMRTAQPTASFKFDWNQTADPYLLNFTPYPGDAYVDYIGADLYDESWSDYPYPVPCDATCRTTHQESAWNNHQLIGLNSVRDFAILHGKPMSIPEWGLNGSDSNHGGWDNPVYMQNMYDFIMNPSNNVAYHAYFDVEFGDFPSQISPGHNNYQTLFPVGSAMYKQFFGAPCTFLYPANSTPPAEYAASWNLLAPSKELLLGATCNGNNLNVTAGNVATLPYIFKTGYYWSSSAWQPYTLSGTTPMGAPPHCHP